MPIKWLRLKSICERLLDARYSVQIHGSTSLTHEIKAAVNVHGNDVDIAVNLAYAKTLDNVVRQLSHELAHIILNSDDDSTQAFAELWIELQNKITKQYNAG